MNPLRSVFLALSRTPPALLLSMIIGIAGVTSLVIVNDENNRNKNLDLTIADMKHKAEARTKIVYVTADVPEGATIPSDKLEEKEVELGRAPVDAITGQSMAAGRIAKFGLQAGQVVSSHDLAPLGVQLGFESHLKAGQRAVTFAVDANSGVGGFINPDSRVDIMGMVGAGQDTKVAPILSDVEIVAVGQMFEKQQHGNGAMPASSVTVAVNPADTQKLIKAIAASKLYLALRNGADHTPVTTVDVTALFPVKATTSVGLGSGSLTDISSNTLPAPSPLPQPPVMPDPSYLNSSGNGNPAYSSVAPVPPPLHEIEIWTGGKKDVVIVPRS